MTPDQLEYFVNYLTGVSEALISHREELDELYKRVQTLEAKDDVQMRQSKDNPGN